MQTLKKDTTAARAAAARTFAARRRRRAVAELEAQGYIVTLTKPVDEREGAATTQPTRR